MTFETKEQQNSTQKEFQLPRGTIVNSPHYSDLEDQEEAQKLLDELQNLPREIIDLTPEGKKLLKGLKNYSYGGIGKFIKKMPDDLINSFINSLLKYGITDSNFKEKFLGMRCVCLQIGSYKFAFGIDGINLKVNYSGYSEFVNDVIEKLDRKTENPFLEEDEEFVMTEGMTAEEVEGADGIDNFDDKKDPIDYLIESCNEGYKMFQNYIRAEGLLKGKGISQKDINSIKETAQILSNNIYDLKTLALKVKDFDSSFRKDYPQLKNDITIARLMKLGIDDKTIEEYTNLIKTLESKGVHRSNTAKTRTDLLEKLSHRYKNFVELQNNIESQK